jgi:hypothetical protein
MVQDMKHFDQNGFDEISGTPARPDRHLETSRHVMRNTILARLVNVLSLAFVLLATMLAISTAQAQQTSPTPAADEKFQTFIKVLADPDIRARLEALDTPAVDTPDEPAPSTGDRLSELEALYRGHFSALGKAIPRIPEELSKAANIIGTDVNAGAPGKGIAIVALLIALGYVAEWLFRRVLPDAGEVTRRSLISGTRKRTKHPEFCQRSLHCLSFRSRAQAFFSHSIGRLCCERWS